MIRVLVAATDMIVRAGLESILRASSEVVVASSSDLATVTTLIADSLPDVVLVGLELDEDEPMSEKLLALGPLSAPVPAIVVLVESIQGDWIASALRLGVRAILPRSATSEEIVPTLVAAAAGLVVLHPDIFDYLMPILPSTARTLDDSSLVQSLTPREIEVLAMIAEGLSNKAIARRLRISEHTVKFHVSSIFTKLNASSRTEAVTLGARQGLIML